MYVILTSKPGQFRTEVTEGLKPLEAYDYLFYGQKKAHFVIAELVRDDTRIRVVEDDPSRRDPQPAAPPPREHPPEWTSASAPSRSSSI